MKKVLFFLFLISISVFSQDKKEYSIGILLDNVSAQVEPIMLGLQNEIKAVVGEDAIINFEPYNLSSNNFDVTKVRASYQQLINGDTDIILAFGAISNLVVTRQSSHDKPTILFGAVNSDILTVDSSESTSGINNFNYLISSQSYSKDLETFKDLVDFKKVAVLIEDFIPDVLPIRETFDKEFEKLGATYTLVPFRNVKDIKDNIGDADAIYMAGGFFLNEQEITELANYFIENKLPSFTATTIEDVVAGFMATNQAQENLSRFFRRIALNVEAIVNGVNASELPVYIDYHDKLTLNYNTLQHTEVAVQYKYITSTNFVGDYENVLSERRYNLLDVLTETVKGNLSLQSSLKNIDLKNQDVKLAKSNYLPDITASASGRYLDPKLAEVSFGLNPEYKTDGNILLNQTLFSAEANANISIQKNLEKAEQENYNVAVLDALINASTAYFNTLILKSNTKIQAENLDVTKRNLEIAQNNFDAGQSGKTDVLRFKSEHAQNTQSLVEAINELEQSFYDLNLILNNDMKFKIDVDEAELAEGVFKTYNYESLKNLIEDPKSRSAFTDFLILEAKANAPEIASINYNLEAVERSMRLNGSGRFVPTLALQGQYNRNFNQWGKGSTPSPILDDNYNVGVNLSIPIFQRNQQNINRQIATIQQDQLNINRDNIELNIERNINEAVLGISNEISNIELSKISEEAAMESLDLVQTSYSSGAVSIVELIDAQRNYLQAQLSRANATYNYLLSMMILERYLGKFFMLNTEASNQAFIQRFKDFLLSKN
jgi:outer membrane protein TolC